MNTKIFAVSGGFYFFGTEVDAPEGYLALTNAAMFGGYSGDAGVPGVTRGDSSAKVTLDRFEEGKELVFPVSSVFAILPSIDLYKFKGAKVQ